MCFVLNSFVSVLCFHQHFLQTQYNVSAPVLHQSRLFFFLFIIPSSFLLISSPPQQRKFSTQNNKIVEVYVVLTSNTCLALSFSLGMFLLWNNGGPRYS